MGRRSSSSRSSSSEDRKKKKKDKKSHNRDESRKSKKHKEKEHKEKKENKDKHHSKPKRKDSRDRSKRKYSRSRSSSKERKRHYALKPKPQSPRNYNKRSGGFKFDSPPPEVKMMDESKKNMMANLHLLYEMIPNLNDYSPNEINHQLQILEEVSALQSQNIEKKLYIGNIRKDINAQSLTEMLNHALQKLNINTEPPGNSIVNSWISPNCQYAIVEFRSADDAENGLALNNISLFGLPLKVGKFRVNSNAASFGRTSSNFMNLLGITGVGADHTLLNKPFRICLPSKILVLLNMMTCDQLLVQEEYEDIIQDIKDVVSRYGKIVSMHAPQPKEGQNDCAGMGHVFVEYSAVSSAQYARREITKKIFSKKLVECCYHEENKFHQKIYDIKFGYLK